METGPHPHLTHHIRALIDLRKKYPVLSLGDYQEIYVASQQLVFKRTYQGQEALVILNASEQRKNINTLKVSINGQWKNVFPEGGLKENQVEPYGMAIFVLG